MEEKEFNRRCENGEPAMRSCWKCNPAHKYLKKADYLIWCFSCGNLYFKGRKIKIKKDK